MVWAQHILDELCPKLEKIPSKGQKDPHKIFTGHYLPISQFNSTRDLQQISFYLIKIVIFKDTYFGTQSIRNEKVFMNLVRIAKNSNFDLKVVLFSVF